MRIRWYLAVVSTVMMPAMMIVPVMLTPAMASAATSSETVNVSATQPWTDAQLPVAGGITVSFKASGTINVSSGNPDFTNTAAGQGPADPHCIASPNTNWGGGWIVMGLPCWSLIGKIGNDGTPFEIGNSLTYTVPAGASGELYLGVNDQSTAFIDNSGSWSVDISWPPTAKPNGCSTISKGISYRDVFRPACDTHDVCYINRGGLFSNNIVKWDCDITFLRDMQGICSTRSDKQNCLIWAGAYFAAVVAFGNPFFYSPIPAMRAGPPSF